MIDEDKTLELIKMVKDALNKEVGKEELQQQNEDKEVVDTSNTIEHKDNEQVKDRDYLELLKEYKGKELKRHELLKILGGRADLLNTYKWKGYIREVRMGLYKVDV
jgi:hypothetical protein